MSVNPLSIKELQQQAPSLFTEQPYHEVSDKYHFIPTIEVIEEIKKHNWHPVAVAQSSVRDIEKEGYQQHLVRFRHFDDLLFPRDNAIELLLFNSHDRSKRFSLSAGIYRFVCANGLVLAEQEFESYKIKHIGNQTNDVSAAIAHITEIKSHLMQKIHAFETMKLSEVERVSFAKNSAALRFEDHLEVDYKDLLKAHRPQDQKDDLYTTLNVIQENLIRGSVKGVNKESRRKFTSKPITSIAKDIQINQGLWALASRIALIKEPQWAMAA